MARWRSSANACNSLRTCLDSWYHPGHQVVLLECVVAIVANIKPNLLGTVLNLQRQKPAWIILTLTITMIVFVISVAARIRHLRGTVVRDQNGWPSKLQRMIRNACVIKDTTYDGMRKFFCSALSGRLVVLATCHMS